MTQHTTFLNYRETGADLEINTLPSQTQPDQVLSIREMLTRHVSGLPIASNHENGAYHGDIFIPDVKSLDLTEIEDLRDYYAGETQRMEKFLSEQQKSGEADKPKTSDGQQTSDSDPEPQETP